MSVKFPPLKLTELNVTHGAPMGRSATHRTGLTDPQFQLERMPLVDGGYDCGGAYWGTPDNLWCADFTTPITGTTLVRYFLRAASREEAMAMVRKDYRTAQFLPETGSIIEQTIEFLQKWLDGIEPTLDEEDCDTVEDTESEIACLQEELDRIRSTK